MKTEKFFDYQNKRKQAADEATKKERIAEGNLTEAELDELINDIDL